MSDILSSIFGGGSNNDGGQQDGGLAGNLPSGLKMAAVALLVQQLMKHSQHGAPQGQGGGVPADTSGMGGGFGGGLGGILGGGLGGLLGGLGGLLGGLRNQGLGQHVDSWVGHGPNKPIGPQELERTIDPSELDQAARQAGTDRGTLLDAMSRMMPGLVDHMTPQGRLPEREEDLPQGGRGLGDLVRSALGGLGGGGGTGNIPAGGGGSSLYGGAGGGAGHQPGLGAGGEAGIGRFGGSTVGEGSSPASGPMGPRTTDPGRDI